MKRKIVWLVVSGLMVLALLAASCAPTVEEAAPPEEKPAAPAEAVAPAEKPAAPTGPEMVKLSLKKRDGTVVEKMVEKPRYGGELIVAREMSIVGWDEAYFIQGQLSPYIGLTQAKLLQGDWTLGPAGTEETTYTLSISNLNYATGDLAESYEVVQPDTLIFHIRQGVHYGLNPALEASRLVGGRELTADDIVWTLRRVYFDIKTSGAYRSALTARPVDVYATDKYTVVVKALPEQIWWTLSYVSIYGVTMHPPEPAKKWGDHNDWARVVGPGPFILKDYVAMSQVTWVRNPNYWGKDPLLPENQLPYVDTVKMLIIPDASTRMSALRAGRVDVDGSQTMTWEDAASLKKTSPQLKSTKTVGSYAIIGGRLDKPELPFKDIRVRRALNMAINYQEMLDTYYGGEGAVLGFPLGALKEWEKAYTPPEELGLAADGFDTKKLYGYHPAEAKQLLAEAGYPKGFKTEAVLWSEVVDFASMVKAYWAAIGVDLVLDVKEYGVYISIRNAKTYKEMIVSTSGAASVGYNLFYYRSGQTFNYAMVYDAKLEEGYTRMGAIEPWTDEWFKVLKENFIYVIHQAYYPATSPMSYSWVFWQPWVKGFQGEQNIGSSYRLYPKYVWIDQALKKARGR